MNYRHFHTTVTAAIGLGVCLLLAGCCSSTVTTVVFVRHAERLNNTDASPLSPAGFQRARALRHALDSAGIQTIFVSDKLRSRQTADSLRIAHSLPQVQIPKDSISELVDSLRGRSGQRLLVVGHSDTVPQIIAAFGVEVPPLSEGEFDKMFVLTVRQRATRLLRLQYGAPSP
jgi:phosphohistidine phosphatase SixA